MKNYDLSLLDGLYNNTKVESFWGKRQITEYKNNSIHRDKVWECNGGIVFTKNKTNCIIFLDYKRYTNSAYYKADVKFVFEDAEYNFFYNTNMSNFIFREDSDDVFSVCEYLCIKKDEFSKIISHAIQIISFISVVCFVSPSGSFDIDEESINKISGILDEYRL